MGPPGQPESSSVLSYPTGSRDTLAGSTLVLCELQPRTWVPGAGLWLAPGVHVPPRRQTGTQALQAGGSHTVTTGFNCTGGQQTDPLSDALETGPPPTLADASSQPRSVIHASSERAGLTVSAAHIPSPRALPRQLVFPFPTCPWRCTAQKPPSPALSLNLPTSRGLTASRQKPGPGSHPEVGLLPLCPAPRPPHSPALFPAHDACHPCLFLAPLPMIPIIKNLPASKISSLH